MNLLDKTGLTYFWGKLKDYFVAKVTGTTTYKQAYVKNTNGTQTTLDISTSAVANSLAQRDANGNLDVGTPSSGNHATPRDYVDTAVGAKSTVSGTYDSNGWTTITIDGTTKNIPSGGGGGSVTLYRHNILLNTSANKITFQIISTSNTAYTKTTLVNFFGTNSAVKVMASGANYSNSRVKTVYQISGSDSTHYTIYFVYDDDGSVGTGDTDVTYSGTTVTDKVDTIS